MKNYPDYKIERIATFYQLYKRFLKSTDTVAFVEDGREKTYGALYGDIKNAAGAFSFSRRFVLINCNSKYNFTVAYFAAVLSGNIACLQHFAEDVAPYYAEFDFAAVADDSFVEKAKNVKNARDIVDLACADEICTALGSSGTTDEPKTIALSQNNIISDLLAGMEKYTFPMGGRYVSILPYAHAFGLVCDLLAPLYSLSTICVADDVISFFAALPVFNPTALNITPGLVEVLCGRIASSGIKNAVVGDSLVKILSGGADTGAQLAAKMRGYGINVCGCYGLSECSPCVSVNRDEYYRDGSAGVALNCNRISIDENGCITVEGSNVMLGYLDRHGNLTEKTNGVFRTGDLGEIDGDGFLYVYGRADDVLVLKSGVKIVPQTAEKALFDIDGVAEAVVYIKGGNLAATVVLKNESYKAEVRRAILGGTFCGQKLNQIVFSGKPLARNALGKLQRNTYGD